MEVVLSKNKTPMKNFILFISVILVLLSCKKEKIDLPELIGTWQFYRPVRINTSSFSPQKYIDFNPNIEYIQPFGYDFDKYGTMTLEISEKGEFKFTSFFGKEKFRVINKESIEINYQGGILNGWNFYLKDKSGQTFEFKVFYDGINNKLYTVPWVKGTVYYTYNAPYAGNESIKLLGVYLNFGHYSEGENNLYFTHEYLGYFQKI